jgi:hypothetical protein
LPNCWRPIFLVFPKLDRCQVDLPNCWSCSKQGLKCDGVHELRQWVLYKGSQTVKVCKSKLLNLLIISRVTSGRIYPLWISACSFGWWLMAGAGLFWEKSIAGWLLVADLFWEKSTASWWLIS